MGKFQKTCEIGFRDDDLGLNRPIPHFSKFAYFMHGKGLQSEKTVFCDFGAKNSHFLDFLLFSCLSCFPAIFL